MKHAYSIQWKEISLKPIDNKSIDKMRLLRNRNRNWFVFAEEITPEKQQTWYKHYLLQQGDYMFSAFYHGTWIGVVALYNVSNESAEFGRLMVDQQTAGCSGLGAEITAAVCQIGFQQLWLRSIRLDVYADNIAAQITYLKAGFRITGLLKDPNGRDMLRMVIVNKAMER